MTTAVAPLASQPPEAARAGADLRDARERLNVSLEDVASRLHIRQPHLEALEEGRISLLPGNTYALGFVRNYAATIGLDPEEMVRRFRAETTIFDHSTELAFPVPASDRRLPVRALLALGLALATGAAAGWYYLAGEGGVSAATLAVIPRYLGPQYLGPRYLEFIAEQAVALAPDGLKKLVATAAPGATAPLQPVDRLTPLPGDGRIMLRALAEVSFLVKDGSGAVLLNRIMQPGESWVAPARSDLILTTGNARETEILVDGTPVGGPGGGDNAATREILLDPDLIKDGRLRDAVVSDTGSGRAGQ